MSTEETSNQSKKGSPRDLLRLISYARRYKLRLTLALASLIIAGLLGLIYPKLVGDITDAGLIQKDAVRLNRLAAILMGLFVCQAVFSFFRSYLLSYTGEKIIADVRNEVYAHLVSLPFSFFSGRRVGELTSRLASDVGVIQNVATGAIMELLRVATVLVGGVAIISFRSPRLTLIMLAIVPLITISGRIYGRYIRKLSTHVQDKLAEASSVLQESLSSIRIVQSFVRENYERSRYAEQIQNAFLLAVKRALANGGFIAFVVIVMYGGIVVVFWAGSRMVVGGDMTAGDLISFALYTFAIGGAIGGLSELYGSFQSAIGATKRVFEILDTKPEIADAPNAKPLRNFRGQVEFVNVSFSYPDERSVEVLQGVNLEAREGEVIALVGHSGGGKSTLASLIPRFYDVTAGAVLVDGHDVRTVSLSDLRGAIGVVPQETTLFSGTIGENIAYGRLGALPEEIVEAARAAHAHEFISAFPDGYDTFVGEKGVRLSGGQRQRIAIARVLLKDPAILILDEATSSLDSESENLIREALKSLMQGRTSFVIAHRLSTIRHADRILVIENGRIVEQGPHDELLIRGGVYTQLYEIQFQEPTYEPPLTQ